MRGLIYEGVKLFFCYSGLQSHVPDQVAMERGFRLIDGHLAKRATLSYPLLMTSLLVTKGESKLFQNACHFPVR